MGWYGVRHLVMIGSGTYEERVTLWEAESMDGAFTKAEAEAANYASEILRDGKVLGLFQCYQLPEHEYESAAAVLAENGKAMPPPGIFLSTPGSELFSLIRDSDLSPEKYIDRFFDTGTEYQSHWSPDSADANQQPSDS